MAKKATKKKAKATKAKKINKLFPGRKGYRGPKKGWFALLHHETLFEDSHNVKDRVDYVKRQKPLSEIKTRLHNMLYLGTKEPTTAEALAKLNKHIPDHVWRYGEMQFPLE